MISAAGQGHSTELLSRSNRTQERQKLGQTTGCWEVNIFRSESAIFAGRRGKHAFQDPLTSSSPDRAVRHRDGIDLEPPAVIVPVRTPRGMMTRRADLAIIGFSVTAGVWVTDQRR